MATLTKRMLDLLIEHIDGPVHLIKKSPSLMTAARDNHIRARSIYDCFDRGFISYDSKHYTILTAKGKEALCAALAEMAEILLRAKFEIAPPPGLALPSVSADSEQFQAAVEAKGKIVHT